VITNIYNKKTKGPTLMELFTATGKLKKFFWQLEMFNVCTMGDTAHINTIFKFLPHTSTWVHQHSSLLQWSVPLGQRGHVAMVGQIPILWLCSKCTLHSNHRLTCVIFQHKKMTSPPQWPLLGGGNWVVPSICTGFINTCPMVFL
jgi:hypothetical protein